MKWESLENEDLKQLIKEFYVIQKALISSPLGTVNANGTPRYPNYNQKYVNRLEQIAHSLNSFNSFNVIISKAQLPESNNEFSSLSFLDDFEKQEALKLVVVMNDTVIQPPEQFSNMASFFVQTLRTPWK